MLMFAGAMELSSFLPPTPEQTQTRPLRLVRTWQKCEDGDEGRE